MARGHHDIGGLPGAGAIDRTEHQLSDWEILADAVNRSLGSKGIRRTDEERRAREDMDPEVYRKASYYERWIAGVEIILIEKGILTKAEIDGKLTQFEEAWGGPTDESSPDEHAHEHPNHELGYYAKRIYAIRDLLFEKRIITQGDIQSKIDYQEARSPANGARIVARAWVDADFKARLIADPKAACAELGIDASTLHEFVVLENTERTRHMVVCTLCSCYPTPILGRPPDWYKSFNYRQRAVKDPRGVMREFGLALPGEVEVRVHDSTADIRYLVLPLRPKGTEKLSEIELARLVTRDSMIGVMDALPAVPGD
jgi:nitrile hydratase